MKSITVIFVPGIFVDKSNLFILQLLKTLRFMLSYFRVWLRGVTY